MQKPCILTHIEYRKLIEELSDITSQIYNDRNNGKYRTYTDHEMNRIAEISEILKHCEVIEEVIE